VAKSARELLVRNREEAKKLTEKIGVARMRKILEASEHDLLKRLKGGSKQGTFTYEQSKVALAQVREVLKGVKTGIQDTLVDSAKPIAEKATEGTVDYLGRMDKQFKGIVQPMALDEAAVFERAVNGAQTSLLRRLASSGEPVVGADGIPHPAKQGILDRYGENTIGHFEDILQRGVLTKKSWADMRSEITEASPFLQGAPGYWSERIVRTESQGMLNRANWEANREADAQLGDMVKITSGVFDDRTASDSYASHGMIRRPEEAFETWFGLMQHPPDRPNDRSLIVPHRIAWPIPPYLAWKTNEEIAKRWAMEKRKGPIPPRPKMTTIELERFGKG
jgi:hypothetical protein